MKGCDPTPNIGLKRLITKRFRVKEVDEFRTSKTCNSCMGELKRYWKRNGKLSYVRLYCDACGGEMQKPSKRFVNRDENAAQSILLAGTSAARPEALSLKQRLEASLDPSSKKKATDANKRPVAAGQQSSDPLSRGTSGERRRIYPSSGPKGF